MERLTTEQEETNKKFQAEFEVLKKALQDADNKYVEDRKEYEKASSELIRRERKYFRTLSLLTDQMRRLTSPSDRDALRGMDEDCKKKENEVAEYRATVNEKLEQVYESLTEVSSLKSRHDQIVFNTLIRERDLLKKQLEDAGVTRADNVSS